MKNYKPSSQNNLARESIVCIISSNKKIAGTGFFASDRLVLTCAHVVIGAKSFPGAIIWLRLYNGQDLAALVELEYWRDVDKEDIAVLRLLGDPPFTVNPLRLGTSTNTKEHSFETYGFPEGYPDGLWGYGKINTHKIEKGFELIQITSREITNGFSGAPIFNEKTQRVIGMVTARTKADLEQRKIDGNILNIETGRLTETAFATPSLVLVNVCSELIITDICPYFGLRAFTEEEEDLFYGRDLLISVLLERLRQYPKFLAVIGASGSGKTSVVQAGLLPKLQQGKLAGFTQPCSILKLRPNSASTLESALLMAFTSIEDNESRADDVWTKIQDHLRKNLNRSVFFIDQFEDIFILFPNEQETFINNLSNLLELNYELTLIIALRPDYYALLLQSALSKFLQSSQVDLINQVNVSRPEKEELKAVIVQPAERVGLRLESRLIETLLKDLEATKNPLPLLEVALMRLWEMEHENNLLTQACYESPIVGKVAGSITQWANEAYEKFLDSEKSLARYIFTRLILFGSDSTTDTIRRLPSTDLLDINTDDSTISLLIDRLAKARLLIVEEKTVEIIHEELLRQWGKLKEWVREDRSFQVWHQKIEKRVQEWEESSSERGRQDQDKLLRGLDLLEATNKLQQKNKYVTSKVCNFIHKSKHKQQRQRWQIVSIILLVVSVFMLSLIDFQNSKMVKISAIASTSERLLLSNRGLDALVKAIEAEDQSKRFFLLNDITKKQVQVALQKTALSARESNRLEGHTGGVNSISFSPSGLLLASASNDATIKIWKSNGEIVQTLKGHAGPITSAIFSPDGKIVASTSNDGTVKLWNLDNKISTTLEERNGSVLDVSFNSAGTVFASANSDGSIQLWDASGEKRHLVKHGNRSVTSVCFSSKGILASASKDGVVRLWNSHGHPIQSFPKQNDWVLSINFSPDGLMLASASRDGAIKIWDLAGNLIASQDNAHTDRIYDIKFSPNGEKIASASRDGTIKLWSLDSEELRKLRELYTFQGHENEINSISFSPNGKTIASASLDRTVRLWKVDGQELDTFSGHNDWISSISFSPSGKFVASADRKGVIKIWDLAGRRAKTFQGDINDIYSINFNTKEEILAAGGRSIKSNSDGTTSEEGLIELWDLDGKLSSFSAHASSVTSVNFSPDGSKLASASLDKTLKLWSSLDGWKNVKEESPMSFNGHRDWVQDVSFSPTDSIIASASSDGTVRLWSLDGREAHLPLKHGYGLRSVQFSPDGKTIVSAGIEGEIKLWNLGSQDFKILKGYSAGIFSTRFSRNGILASANLDGTVKLWSIAGKEISTLNGHTDEVRTISFSPDGKTIASAGNDKFVKIWRVETLNSDELMERGCRSVQDYLRYNVHMAQKKQHFCDRTHVKGYSE